MFLTLPYREIKDKSEFSRVRETKYEVTSMLIESGFKLAENNKHVRLEVPYGTIPMQLLFYIVSEAKRTNSPRIKLGNSFTEILHNTKITKPLKCLVGIR